MNKTHIIEQTIAYVKSELAAAEGGHDWFHIQRVYNNAKTIAAAEDVDLFTVQLGALLHDIADAKFYDGDEGIGPKKAENFLTGLSVAPKVVQHVKDIVANVSFKGGNFKANFSSKELQVVQDADRLDALGAIGIARTFNYGGFKNRAIYDPAIPVDLKMSKEAYKKSTAPTINHFYEKLLLLKDRMHTQTGREMAEIRHQFMENFLQQFYTEWEGK